MTISKILFPTDFSEESHALSVASSLARDTGAEILIVHVKEPPPPNADGDVHLEQLESRESLEAQLHQVAPTDRTIAYRHQLLEGDPAAEILRAAEAEQVDLIVMSTHGRTGLVRMLMGSVAEAVVRRATCPVLTCKRPRGSGVVLDAEPQSAEETA